MAVTMPIAEQHSERRKPLGSKQTLMDNLMGDLPVLLTPSELGTFLRISKASVYRLVEKRALSFVKVGGSLRFPREEVVKFLEKNRVKSINELK